MLLLCQYVLWFDMLWNLFCSHSNKYYIDPVIFFYPLGRLSESKGRSLVGAILSKVVPATFSTLSSFSKLIWRSEQSPPKNSPKKSDQKPQPFARGRSNTHFSACLLWLKHMLLQIIVCIIVMMVNPSEGKMNYVLLC